MQITTSAREWVPPVTLYSQPKRTTREENDIYANRLVKEGEIRGSPGYETNGGRSCLLTIDLGRTEMRKNYVVYVAGARTAGWRSRWSSQER